MKTEIRQLPISKRLQMNAAMVQEGARLADVGCDHAYCSIYLAGSGRIRRSIAMDVRPGPLSRAEENIRRYGVEDLVETRRSDGLEKLQPGEADCILISGMGGNLMQGILERGMDCVRASKRLVLQPQSECMEFRQYLHSRGFRICAEDMCFDEGKYYTVMQVDPAGAEKEAPENETDSELEWQGVSERLQLLYGPCLIRTAHPVLKEYLQLELHKKEELKERLKQQDSERSKRRQEEIAAEVEELRLLYDRMSS